MSLSLRPTDATLGAVITGADLRALSDSPWRDIDTVFLEYGVLFFPAQHLDAKAQLAFALRFGDIEVLAEGMTTIPIANKTPDGQLLEADSDRMKLLRGNEGWHTDSSYMRLASKAAVLSAHVIPSSGSQTAWADARAAYDSLDDTTRARIAGLAAHHSYFYSQAKIGHKVEVGAGYGFFPGESPLRSLVKIHPVTKRPALYVGRHAASIPGMEQAEAEALIKQLNDFICQPPRVYTHHWQPGDVAVWDNRCLLHRACPYDYRQERVMAHTRIKGDIETESALNARLMAA